jgi:hypothetical protein
VYVSLNCKYDPDVKPKYCVYGAPEGDVRTEKYHAKYLQYN